MTSVVDTHGVPPLRVTVPMITPLGADGALDRESTASLVDYFVGAGVDGILVLGSSGENAALSAASRAEAVSTVVAAAAGRAHVMVGVASLGTPDAADDAREYAERGADSILLPAPFGFELSQSELAGHFRAVSEAARRPIVAYEVPGRVKVSLGTDLLRGLHEEGVIAGVKDSSGNAAAARMRSEAFRGTGLLQLTGSEESIDGFLLGGGTGCVPGLANVFPQLHVDLVGRAAAGDWAGAADVQSRICELLDLYFHPLPAGSFSAQFFALVKEALVQLGVIANNTTSSPFTPADQGTSDHVARMLSRAGVGV